MAEVFNLASLKCFDAAPESFSVQLYLKSFDNCLNTKPIASLAAQRYTGKISSGRATRKLVCFFNARITHNTNQVTVYLVTKQNNIFLKIKWAS